MDAETHAATNKIQIAEFHWTDDFSLSGFILLVAFFSPLL